MVKITKCRLCYSDDLESICSLGELFFTGIFLNSADEISPSGFLSVIRCSNCSLVQLDRNFDQQILFGSNYGYRSGLNKTMVSHLQDIALNLQNVIGLTKGDAVLDIASNDGTLLEAYSEVGIFKIGIDPTASLFGQYYQHDIRYVSDFFSADLYFKHFEYKPKIVTSIAMLYDLEDPNWFFQEVFKTLADDGIWFFEQSYAKWMVETCSYDTICHEHLEYYTLKNLEMLLDRNGFKLVDAYESESNGGSIAVTAVKKSNRKFKISKRASLLLETEISNGVNTLKFWFEFGDKIKENRLELRKLITQITSKGETIMALGASTKGNVLLQYCDFSDLEIGLIGEVNPEKFGKFTPGSKIPIVTEKEVYDSKPNYILVLPWHFKQSILSSSEDFRKRGGKLIFPMPKIEIIS